MRLCLGQEGRRVGVWVWQEEGPLSTGREGREVVPEDETANDTSYHEDMTSAHSGDLSSTATRARLQRRLG